MRDARVPNAFLNSVTIAVRPRIALGGGLSVQEEIFGSLEYLSEVPSAGKQFLINLNVPKDQAKKRHELFRSFIRQAKTFYEAASVLHYRAAPLNYYYSFLNLVKAYISLTDPNQVQGKIPHGLSYQFRDTALSSQCVNVGPSNGVFPRFYTKMFGKSLPAKTTKLGIDQILSYCSDITFEYERATTQKHRMTQAHARVLLTGEPKRAYWMIAVSSLRKGITSGFSGASKKFEKYFEEVAISKNPFLQMAMQQYFGFQIIELQSYSFYESKEYDLTAQGQIPEIFYRRFHSA